MDEKQEKANFESQPEEELEQKLIEDQATEQLPKEPEAQSRKAEREMEALALELVEEKDRFLRLAAEYDNFKKRTAKEKEELYASAAADVLKKLLPVFDNLERAGTCKDFDTLKQGVEMILSAFHIALEACGVTEVPAEGEVFDPALHEAIFHEEREDFAENTVCEVLQKGYILGDRVLRHAMVKVAN